MRVRVVQLTPGQLEQQLKRDREAATTVIIPAIRSAAMRGERLLASESPVDLGAYKAGWKTKNTPGGADLDNSSPYAGVIEDGARPHVVPKYVIALIADWAERHGFENAWAFAMGWAKKVAEIGQPARNIVRDRLDRLRAFVRTEFEAGWARRPIGGGW